MMNRKLIIQILGLAAVAAALALGPIGPGPARAAGRNGWKIAQPDRLVEIDRRPSTGRRIRLADRNLSVQEKKRLQKKWQSMTPRQRQQFRQKMQKFNQLPAKDKQLIRRRHNQLREMSPSDRRRLQKKLNQWDKLSPKEQQVIRQRFLNQPNNIKPNRRQSIPSSGGS